MSESSVSAESIDLELPSITADAVSQALVGFDLPLSSDKNMEWLAMAVRRALAITIPDPSDGPNRASNAEVRKELNRLASLTESAWLELFELDEDADSQLLHHASKDWDGEGGTDIGDGVVMGEPPKYRRIEEIVAELDWLAGFMREAAKSTASQGGPWRQSAEKKQRVERGHYLAPIYEAAFGQKVTANNFPNDSLHKAPTPFMAFYSHMVELAFGPMATTNLAEVVKAACQKHRSGPVQFQEGLIPGL